MSNKKKRKVSPSIGSKNSKKKMIKLTINENSVPNVLEDERENIEEKKLSNSDEIEIIILNEEKKNLEQSDQDEKKIESDTTPKKNLEKNKKLNRSQQRSGTLTKFLKKIDKGTESDDLHELKDKQDCQNIFVQKDENEICLNESSVTQTNVSILQNLSQENKQLKDINKSTDHSLPQKSDCDITILSSDNEDLNELDKSTLSENEEITNKPVTPVTSKTDKANKKIIKLTPKQLEKRKEIARKKEEKLRLKKVYDI